MMIDRMVEDLLNKNQATAMQVLSGKNQGSSKCGDGGDANKNVPLQPAASTVSDARMGLILLRIGANITSDIALIALITHSSFSRCLCL
jgi:hypothetical protein